MITIANTKIIDLLTVVAVVGLAFWAIILVPGCVQGDLVIYKAPMPETASRIAPQPVDGPSPKGSTEAILKGALR